MTGAQLASFSEHKVSQNPCLPSESHTKIKIQPYSFHFGNGNTAISAEVEVNTKIASKDNSISAKNQRNKGQFFASTNCSNRLQSSAG
jgi:hypothetical protein